MTGFITEKTVTPADIIQAYREEGFTEPEILEAVERFMAAQRSANKETTYLEVVFAEGGAR